MFGLKYGNWCGPGWSDGRHQPSTKGYAPPVDEFDASCQDHDASYADNDDLDQADLTFYNRNVGRGISRTLAAFAVGVQPYFYGFNTRNKSNSNQTESFMPNNNTTIAKSPNGNNTKTTRLRTNTNGSSKRNTSTTVNSLSKVSRQNVPASFGYTIQTKAPRISRTANTARITGTDFAGSVLVSNTAQYQPAQDVLLNPIYYNGSQLGALARAYSEYRVLRAVVQYIPQVPTSTAGQLLFIANKSVKQPFIAGNSANFLARAFSQQEAIACPIWSECVFECPLSKEWRSVDVLVEADLDDVVEHEIQVYGVASATATCGILLLHYEFEFRDPVYTKHSTNIPCDLSGVSITFTDDTNVNAIGDAIRLSNASIGFSSWNPGAIFRLVFNQAASTLPTGVGAWALLANVGTASATTSTTSGIATSPLTMATGTTIYAAFNSGVLTLYSTYDHAADGLTPGAISYQTATTVAGLYSFFIMAVRMGDASLVQTQ